MKRFLAIIGSMVMAFGSVVMVPSGATAGGGGPSCGSEGQPVAYMMIDDRTGMAPHSTSLNASYSLGCGDAITEYHWDFGDGTTASGMTVEHVFEAEGSWNVTLQVIDEASLTNTHSGVITVRAFNEAPVTIDDSFSRLNSGYQYYIPFTQNDFDAEGDRFDVTIVTQPEHGTLSPYYGYMPDAGYYGVDSFTYKLVDEYGGVSNIATVSIENQRPILAPVAQDDVIETNEDESVNFNVYANDTDDQLLTANAAVIEGVRHGILQPNGGGDFTYTPTANYFGDDTFVYRVTDADGESSQARVYITVASVYDPVPVNARDDFFSTSEDMAVQGNIVSNDTIDPENTATVTVVGSAQHGTVTLNTDGTFTYTPHANYYGNDSFTYQVKDSLGSTDTANVILSVQSVNDAPIASFNYGSSHKPRAFSFANGSSDPEGNSLAHSWNFGDGITSSIISPTHRYARQGTYIVTLTVTDSYGATATTTQTIVVK